MTTEISTSVQDVASIVTQRRQINGKWHRKLVVTCDDGTVLTFLLYAPTAEETRIIEQPDEYIRVEDSAPDVKRSDKPFEEVA